MKRALIAVFLFAAITVHAGVYFGTNSLSGLWFGTNAVTAAYLGTNLVYSGATQKPDVTDYVARWTFAEGTGTNTADVSGNGNTGYFLGSATFGNDGTRTYMKSGPTAGYCTNKNSTLTSVAAGAFSVTFWAKNYAESAANNGEFIQFNGGGVGMSAHTSTELVVGDACVANFSYPSTNNWVFFSFSRTGTSYTGLTNTVSAATTFFSDAGWNSYNHYVIGGAYSYPTVFWKSLYISDVRIYARALSTNEMVTIYNATK